MGENTTQMSLIDLLRDVRVEDDVIAYDFLVSEASAAEIERRIRNQVIEELIAQANQGGVEADISWYMPDDTVRSEYLTDWLRSKKEDFQ